MLARYANSRARSLLQRGPGDDIIATFVQVLNELRPSGLP